MNPGRELDALVAEKVMDKTVIKYTDEYLYVMHDLGGDFFGKKYMCTVDVHNNTFNMHIPGKTIAIVRAYSTDISAAWEVVEKLQWAEPEISWSDEEHCWRMLFWKGANQWPHPAGETAPHAISLAALKAVGAL